MVSCLNFSCMLHGAEKSNPSSFIQIIYKPTLRTSCLIDCQRTFRSHLSRNTNIISNIEKLSAF